MSVNPGSTEHSTPHGGNGAQNNGNFANIMNIPPSENESDTSTDFTPTQVRIASEREFAANVLDSFFLMTFTLIQVCVLAGTLLVISQQRGFFINEN